MARQPDVLPHPTGLARRRDRTTTVRNLEAEALLAKIPKPKNDPLDRDRLWFNKEGFDWGMRAITRSGMILSRTAAAGARWAVDTVRNRAPEQLSSAYGNYVTFKDMLAHTDVGETTHSRIVRLQDFVKGVEDVPLWSGMYDTRSSPEDMAPYIEHLTGVGMGYLGPLVGHESGGDAAADNPNSTALGLTQFTKSTWLKTINDAGERLGVPAGLSRAKKLELRTDPRYAMAMAAELAKQNAAELKQALGRDPTNGEVYMAHFGGASAAKAIQAAETTPSQPAWKFYDADQVAANKSVFYPGNRERTIGDLYRFQTERFGRGTFKATK